MLVTHISLKKQIVMLLPFINMKFVKGFVITAKPICITFKTCADKVFCITNGKVIQNKKAKFLHHLSIHIPTSITYL